eukprot:3185724-Rhodomonas_salina.5
MNPFNLQRSAETLNYDNLSPYLEPTSTRRRTTLLQIEAPRPATFQVLDFARPPLTEAWPKSPAWYPQERPRPSQGLSLPG